MENFPNRHRNHELETLSDRFLNYYFPTSWVINKFQIDYGTDYNCEVVTEKQVTGNNFSIQLKGKETEQNEREIKITLKRTTINRWLSRLEPTMIIVFIADENEAFWKWLEDNTVDLSQTNESFTISIPRHNALSKMNWDAIAKHIKLIFSKRHLLYGIPELSSENEKGWSAFYKNNFEEALSEFYKIVKQIPNDSSVLEAIAISEYSLFNYSKALAFINRAISLDDNYGFHLTKASILTEQGFASGDTTKIFEAINIYQTLLNSGYKPHQLYYNYGSALAKIRDYKGSIDYFKKALELNPNQPAAWNNLGNSYMNIGDHAQEMICYANALQINPNLPETLFSKGSSLFRYFGDASEGLKLMLKATELGNRHEIDNPYVFFWIAEAYLAIGDSKNAMLWNTKGLLFFSTDEYLKRQKLKILA